LLHTVYKDGTDLEREYRRVLDPLRDLQTDRQSANYAKLKHVTDIKLHLA